MSHQILGMVPCMAAPSTSLRIPLMCQVRNSSWQAWGDAGMLQTHLAPAFLEQLLAFCEV